MLSPPPAAATSTRASKAGIVRTIEPCCSSAIHHAWRLHSRLHLGRKCRLEKVALVVRRSEAAGWRWSSSTLNECKPRFLGVAVMHWVRHMAAELRDSRSGRRQGSSSDWRVPYGRPLLESLVCMGCPPDFAEAAVRLVTPRSCNGVKQRTHLCCSSSRTSDKATGCGERSFVSRLWNSPAAERRPTVWPIQPR